MGQAIERFFKVKARGSKISVELLAGFVTFLAMSYILPVNAEILAKMGMSTSGVFASTALVSGAITILMGLLANVPVSLSAGMGLNAFLTYTVCLTLGYSWQECMILLTITGVLFFILSVTPLRLIIINAIPKDIQHIISAGLGAFIAFVGLKGSGIIVSNQSTLVGLGNLGDARVWLALVGILFTLFLMGLKTKHEMINRMAIPLGLLFTATIGVSLHYIGQAAGTTYFSLLPSFYGNLVYQGLAMWFSLEPCLTRKELIMTSEDYLFPFLLILKLMPPSSLLSSLIFLIPPPPYLPSARMPGSLMRMANYQITARLLPMLRAPSFADL